MFMDLKNSHFRKCVIKALSTLEMGLQKHPVPNAFLRPHWHSAEPSPHHLCGLINWLGILIGFPPPHIETRYLFSGVLCSSVSFPLQCHRTKGGYREGRELFVVQLLIGDISNKATGMFNQSEPLEAYPSEGFR